MIRKASVEDIPMIRDLAQVAFMETYKDILSPEQMEYMMEWMYSEESLIHQMTVADHIFFIEDGKGYASFRFDGHTEDNRELFHLEKLYVLPEYQKTGLGKALFDRILDEARTASSGDGFRVELNVNRKNPAVSFYEHLGMNKDRQGDFAIGKGFYMNDFIMALDC